MVDTKAMLEVLADQTEVVGTTVGVTGYCLGGGLALAAAGHAPDRVVAAASFHGGYLATDAPDSQRAVRGRGRAQHHDLRRRPRLCRP